MFERCLILVSPFLSSVRFLDRLNYFCKSRFAIMPVTCVMYKKENLYRKG